MFDQVFAPFSTFYHIKSNESSFIYERSVITLKSFKSLVLALLKTPNLLYVLPGAELVATVERTSAINPCQIFISFISL